MYKKVLCNHMLVEVGLRRTFIKVLKSLAKVKTLFGHISPYTWLPIHPMVEYFIFPESTIMNCSVLRIDNPKID